MVIIRFQDTHARNQRQKTLKTEIMRYQISVERKSVVKSTRVCIPQEIYQSVVKVLLKYQN